MTEDIRAKLAAIPEETADDMDLAMVATAQRENDGSRQSLAAFQSSLVGFNGKILLRIPKSLHKRLVDEAQAEGVSLNQYALYKLSQ